MVHCSIEGAIKNRREDSDKSEEGLEIGDICTDMVELSAEGKALLRNSTNADVKVIETEKTDIGKKPVIYTKKGENSSVLIKSAIKADI